MTINFDTFEEVRTQFFSSAGITSLTFSHRYLRFSNTCVRKFSDTEHIELLVHPTDRLLAVRPCSAENKDAMRWAITHNGKKYGRAISGSAFLGTMYDLFDWKSELKYRLRGEVLYFGGESIILFDVSEPEILIPSSIIQKYADNKDLYIVAQSKRFFTALPTHWQNSFGDKYGKNTRLHDIPIGNSFLLYNSQPELHPTPNKIVGKNIRKLLATMSEGEPK